MAATGGWLFWPRECSGGGANIADDLKYTNKELLLLQMLFPLALK